jgi:hypothetical protein
VTITELPSEKVAIAYVKRGNAENYIKEAMYEWPLGACYSNPYGPTKPFFS